MNLTKQYQEQQEAKRLQNRISSFIGSFKVGTLLNNSGIRKLRGVPPLTLFVLGGNFWDKIRALYVYDAEVHFSQRQHLEMRKG